MTKPTITNTTITYGLFRKGIANRTVDYVLMGKTYATLAEANDAMAELSKSLVINLQSSVEVRPIETGEYLDIRGANG